MSCNEAPGKERRSSVFPLWRQILGNTADPASRPTGSSDCHLVRDSAPLETKTEGYHWVLNQAGKLDCSVHSQGPERTNSPCFPSA